MLINAFFGMISFKRVIQIGGLEFSTEVSQVKTSNDIIAGDGRENMIKFKKFEKCFFMVLLYFLYPLLINIGQSMPCNF